MSFFNILCEFKGALDFFRNTLHTGTVRNGKHEEGVVDFKGISLFFCRLLDIFTSSPTILSYDLLYLQYEK